MQGLRNELFFYQPTGINYENADVQETAEDEIGEDTDQDFSNMLNPVFD